MKSQMDANALLLKNTRITRRLTLMRWAKNYLEVVQIKKLLLTKRSENYDMQCDKIKIENESTVKKLEKQIIVTGSRIEISIPMIVYNRADIEIKQNSYGEDEIIIHNVDSMSLKNLRFL